MNKGDMVEVFKGRKNAPGTKGVIFWMRQEVYGYHNSGVNPRRVVTRVGIRLSDDSVAWDYLSNCRAVEKIAA